jgi:hypothetical protein
MSVKYSPEQLSRFENAKAEIAKAKKEMEKIAKEFFASESDRIFTNHPTLQAFVWTQYTPHWNDGDTTEFGVNDVYYRFSDTPEDSDDCYSAEGFEGIFNYSGSSHPKEKQAAAKEVSGFMKKLEDDLEELFGDHLQITVTRGENGKPPKVSKEEYEHD